MSINELVLTEHFERFIEASVESGRFQDASEVVREGLRLVELREKEDAARLKWLRGAAKQGFDELDRGEGIRLETEEDYDRFFAGIAAEAAGA